MQEQQPDSDLPPDVQTLTLSVSLNPAILQRNHRSTDKFKTQLCCNHNSLAHYLLPPVEPCGWTKPPVHLMQHFPMTHWQDFKIFEFCLLGHKLCLIHHFPAANQIVTPIKTLSNLAANDPCLCWRSRTNETKSRHISEVPKPDTLEFMKITNRMRLI